MAMNDVGSRYFFDTGLYTHPEGNITCALKGMTLYAVKDNEDLPILIEGIQPYIRELKTHKWKSCVK